MASTVWTTEICGVMRKRLEWRGFSIKDVEKWDNQQYDVISMLNLLDRAGNPDQFIQKVSPNLRLKGRIEKIESLKKPGFQKSALRILPLNFSVWQHVI